MLAVLLLARNTPVSRGQIIEAVWGDDVPSSAVNLVQTYVAGLRRALEPSRASRAPAELLTSVGDGYLLRVEPGALDLDAFEQQVTAANRLRAAGDLAGAAVALDDALALWRAEPLGGRLRTFRRRRTRPADRARASRCSRNAPSSVSRSVRAPSWSPSSARWSSNIRCANAGTGC